DDRQWVHFESPSISTGAKKMRHALAVLCGILFVSGCSSFRSDADKKPVALAPEHPAVVMQGIDGTTMSGELLNGSITVDSGQGELTLLTDHLHSIAMSTDIDKVDSDSMKV